MLRLPTWTTGLVTTAALIAAALLATAPAAQAQQITAQDLPTLQKMVDAEIAKGPKNNASNVWGLFKQLEQLTAAPHTDSAGKQRPAGPLHLVADANYYCAKIGFFLLKNVAGNPDMFGGWVWPRTKERISWALNQNQNHKEAWLLWGKIHQDAVAGRNWKEAERGFRFDLVLNPKRSESMRYHVFCLLQLGRPQQALKAADTYLNTNVGSARLHELRGDALYSLGRYRDARNAYAVAVDLHLGDGQIFDKAKNADLKHQEQAAVAAGKPSRPMPNWYLQYLKNYFSRHPDQFISEEKRGHLLWTIWSGLQRNGHEMAAQFAADCIACFAGLEEDFPKAGPRAAVWCDYQADIYRYDLTKLPQLQATVLRGLKADPGSQAVMDRLNLPGAGVNLFDYYKGNDVEGRAPQYQQGVDFVNQLLPLLPTTSPVDRARRAVMHQFAFECHKGLAQFPQANAAIQAAIDADPSNPVYPNSYGLLLRYTGDTAGAKKQFQAALEIAPSHPWAAQNLAGLLIAEGAWPEFHDHCSRALYWAQDSVEQTEAELKATLDPQRFDGPATRDQVAAARESVDAAKHDLLKIRRLWQEGLQLERAATAAAADK